LSQVVAEALAAHLPPTPDAVALEDLDARLRIRLDALRAHARRHPTALTGDAAILWAKVVVDARDVCTEMQAIVLPNADNGSQVEARRLELLVTAFSRRLDAAGPAIRAARIHELSATWEASAQNLIDEWAALVTLAREITAGT
jgi:hypothetical protein